MSQIQIQSVVNTNTRVQYTNAKLSWGQTRVTPLVGEAHKRHQLVNTLDSHPALKKNKKIEINIARGTTDPRVEFCLPK